MPYLNLGVVAHVDAGKTSLTERLLFDAGVTSALGSVDAGTTRTDSLDLERRRGITIRAAVTSFALPTGGPGSGDGAGPGDGDGDLVVNLLDTPGHPDFIAEVERSLAVLDAAVLVLSAVEGVQPQSVVIWRALRRLGIPTLVFVNKIDRAGADVARVAHQAGRRLGAVVAVTRVDDEGAATARVSPVPLTDEDVVASVAEVDDRVLTHWLDGARPGAGEVRRALRTGAAAGRIAPLLCGSALTGAGLDELRRAVASLLPRAASDAPAGGPAVGSVFAVDRDERGRRAWVRLWSGRLRVRDRVALDGAARPATVTELAVSTPDGVVVGAEAVAGQIVVLRGPAARIGDRLGRPSRGQAERVAPRFPPPVRHALIEPVDPVDRTAMFAALAELAEEDPLVGLRLDPGSGEAALSLHGEVQKEVIGSLLEERYGVPVTFSATSVVCLERVVGSGSAQDLIGQRGNPYLAGLGVRVSARPVGHGVGFSPGVERGNLPRAFVAAAEEGVRAALTQGRHGWQVTDCLVELTASAYWPRQSKPHQGFDKSISTVAADFRHLAPVVVAAALDRAGTRVCEPVDRFELDLPADALGAVAALLGGAGAATLTTTAVGGYLRVTGYVASSAVPALTARLPDLTRGEGVWESRLDHHDPVTGRRPPRRRRTGPDPRDRQAWFRDVPR